RQAKHAFHPPFLVALNDRPNHIAINKPLKANIIAAYDALSDSGPGAPQPSSLQAFNRAYNNALRLEQPQRTTS
ncbi:MAG: hypothetical protein KKC58_06385, partial [Gammaproteobacteria bacterium]|nr:hypothetical protein [Gammaproteobacteria bacterium]